MAKPFFKLKCRHCHRRLADFFIGPKHGEVDIHTNADFLLNNRKVDTEGIAIAICSRCGGETEFPAKHLPGPATSPGLH